MADIYAMKKDMEKTIACLNCAADYAIKFDTLTPDATHTSLVANGIKCGGIWCHDGHNNSYGLLKKLTSGKHTQYDFLRESNPFISVMNKLKIYAQ